jgi:hypothetical protein
VQANLVETRNANNHQLRKITTTHHCLAEKPRESAEIVKGQDLFAQHACGQTPRGTKAVG